MDEDDELLVFYTIGIKEIEGSPCIFIEYENQGMFVTRYMADRTFYQYDGTLQKKSEISLSSDSVSSVVYYHIYDEDGSCHSVNGAYHDGSSPEEYEGSNVPTEYGGKSMADAFQHLYQMNGLPKLTIEESKIFYDGITWWNQEDTLMIFSYECLFLEKEASNGDSLYSQKDYRIQTTFKDYTGAREKYGSM